MQSELIHKDSNSFLKTSLASIWGSAELGDDNSEESKSVEIKEMSSFSAYALCRLKILRLDIL